MRLTPEICERARLARDPRFDGRFFIGVVTTRVYCRPICPVRPPRAKNVRFYPSAAAAAEAGFRPCLRCRPESAPGSPAWRGTSSTLSRALCLLDQGALDEGGVDALSERLGVGARQLRRIFLEHLGAPPVAVAQTRRLHFAKKLIDETDLRMAEVAVTAGYGSVRRFNAAIQRAYGRPPSALRRSRARRANAGALSLRLRYRPPLAWNALLSFLSHRAVAGIEEVVDEAYRRTIAMGDDAGVLSVRLAEGDSIEARIELSSSARVFEIAARVRRMFDLSADPMEIARRLRRDRLLAPKLDKNPGLRVPGAWDGFELAVRAVLGQQVTVKGAATLAARLASKYGRPLPSSGSSTLVRLFPTASALARADLTTIGLPRPRARAVRALAAAVRDGELQLDGSVPAEDTVERLLAIDGVGAWTAEYVAMRALGEPDALPAGDAGLRRALANGSAVTPSALVARAEAWRPWRSYAVLHLWQSLADEPAPSNERKR